jgi:hypothetical protein
VLEEAVRAVEHLHRVRLEIGVPLAHELRVEGLQVEPFWQPSLELDERSGVDSARVEVTHRPVDHAVAVDVQDQLPPAGVVAVSGRTRSRR